MEYCLLLGVLNLTTLSEDDVKLIAREHYRFSNPEVVFKSPDFIEVRDSNGDVLYIESEYAGDECSES